MKKTIIFATTNLNKINEIDKIFAPYNIEIKPLPHNPNLIPPEENGKSFTENADIKAIYYSKHSNIPVMADDSGLCVAQLNNQPGIYSARYAGPEATDLDNIKKLLQQMQHIEINRTAKFVCALTLAYQGKVIKQEIGDVQGKIIKQIKGTNGFGYDPVFFFPPYQKTFAQITKEDKNNISHRYQACKKMLNFIQNWNF